MKNLPKSLLLLAPFIPCFIFGVNIVFGEKFIPPVPDKSQTLPANDGGADGCDSSRFKCVMGGEAVLDKQTGLVWTRRIRIKQKAVSWEDAVKFCQNLEIGGKTGWRLPTRDEFTTVLDTSTSIPALPVGHPFDVSQIEQFGGSGQDRYWTSTEYGSDKQSVWLVSIRVGTMQDSLKFFDAKVWPVRDAE